MDPLIFRFVHEKTPVWMAKMRCKLPNIIKMSFRWWFLKCKNNNFSKKYFLSVRGKLLWEISHDISSHYTTYDLVPAFYKENLLLPLDDRILYINVNDGTTSREYLNEEIDQVFSFNENSVQNNTMKFFIDEFVYEYIVVDLDKNLKKAEGLLDLDNPERGMWINNLFVDVASSGAVTVYELPLAGENEPAILWRENYNVSMELLDINKQNTYLLDKDNNYVYEVSTRSGKEIKKTSLLWPGNNVKIRSQYFIVQSRNKLYVLPI